MDLPASPLRPDDDCIDLITANPHENGLVFPADVLRRALDEALPRTRVYSPDPRGQVAARDAVAAWYRTRGWDVGSDSIVLTPGTSLAYFYLLRLLLDPGDEVLVPRPGYPLFEDLCAVAGVRIRYYHLRADGTIDFEEMAFQCTSRTRVLMVVSPHNPLGSVVDANGWAEVARVCRAHRLALVLDEVFCEFLTDPQATFCRPDPHDFALVCILNGFSKMYSLPGYKLGWMALAGRDSARLLAPLEYLSDVFLPVSELAQAAAPAVFAAGEGGVRQALAQAWRERRTLLQAALARPLLPASGGVYGCLPLTADEDEDQVVERSRAAGVLLHPGHFYHLPDHVVMTCAAGPDRLREGARRLNGVLLSGGAR